MFKGIFDVDSSDKTKELMDKIDALLPAYHAAKLGAEILERIEAPWWCTGVLVNSGLWFSNIALHFLIFLVNCKNKHSTITQIYTRAVC